MTEHASAIGASTFRLDVKGAEVRAALHEGNVRTVLLKGRAFADLLYGPGDPRDYSDVDLLVSPTDAAHAHRVLYELGFRPDYGSAPIDLASRPLAAGSLHGGAWYRERDRVTIDLHHTLPQLAAEPQLVWSEITRRTVSLDVGGEPTEVLDRCASALLVALHAAHHGQLFGSAVEDLRRATERFDPACWQQALELATTLDASVPMGIGLGLIPGGRVIAERLGLLTVPDFAVQLRWNEAPWGSSFIESLAGQQTMPERLHLLALLIWPKPDALRLGSSLARRSRRGLVAAYAVRPLQLLRRAPAALLAWRRLRRSTATR